MKRVGDGVLLRDLEPSAFLNVTDGAGSLNEINLWVNELFIASAPLT